MEIAFFKNSFRSLKQNDNIAGIRFINSIENYNRALENNFKVVKPIVNGINAACSIINKDVWEIHKFNENLIAIEDKLWSEVVMKNGYEILDLNETFFYFLKRDKKSSLKRYKIQTIAHHQISKEPYPSLIRIILSLFKKILFTNNVNYLKTIIHDFRLLNLSLKYLEY